MIDLKGFKGFCFCETLSLESRRLIVYCNINDIPFIIKDGWEYMLKEYKCK